MVNLEKYMHSLIQKHTGIQSGIHSRYLILHLHFSSKSTGPSYITIRVKVSGQTSRLHCA